MRKKFGSPLMDTDVTVGGKYGHEGFPLGVLAEAVKKIKSPGLVGGGIFRLCMMRQFLEPAGEVEKVQFDLRVFDRPSQFHQPDRGLAVITGARSIPAHCAVPIPNREHSCQAIRANLWQHSRVTRSTTRLALSCQR